MREGQTVVRGNVLSQNNEVPISLESYAQESFLLDISSIDLVIYIKLLSS